MSRASTRSHAQSLEWGALAVLALGAAGLFGFVRLAHYVERGELHDLDERILLAMRSSVDTADPLGPPWFEELVRDLTAFGAVGTLALVTLGVAGYLLADGRGRTCVVLLAVIAGGLLLSLGLKAAFDRPRPDLVPHGSHVYTMSFPSGHAMLSAVTYMTLGAMLARVQERLRLRIYVLAVAAALTVLVGASRVYLGVHWPSDVLAGWAIGCTFAVAAWFLTRGLQRHGDIEPEPPPQ